MAVSKWGLCLAMLWAHGEDQGGIRRRIRGAVWYRAEVG